MTSKLTITDERVISVIERLEHYACNLKWTNVRVAQDLLTAADGLRELQERRKAAMDSEPVAWISQSNLDALSRGHDALVKSTDNVVQPVPLYRHAQPAPDREQIRNDHAEWSQSTFGNVGPIGPLKHLSKEALEAAADPSDLSEWADMQFLLWDAQRRAGITDEQITQAMIEKLAVNKQREWPAPKDGEPRLHIKTQPAPVMPDGYVLVPKEPTQAMCAAFNDSDYGRKSLRERYVAMLAAAQQPQDEPQNIPEIIPGWIPVSERMPDDDDFVYIWPRPDFGVELHVGQYCECSPKGDGWYAQVYEQNYGIEWYPITVTHWMPLPAAPQEVKSES